MVGAKYHICDLHIHTPKSLCYKDKAVTPDQIVKKAIEKGISVIAITDHNRIDGIEEILNAAKNTDLIVFPGMEITAQGGHVLALFDPGTSLSVLDDALTSCGLPKEIRGTEEAIGNPFIEVLKTISKSYGGLTIAAHCDGPKGFLRTIEQGQLKMQIYKDENLHALELVDLVNLNNYLEGKDPNYNRKIACLQGSDAHNLDEIGGRYTLIKMDHISVVGLLHAFNEPSLRIAFPSTYITNPYPFIKYLRVNQGFLAGETLEFNKNLNCLLGGPGSGKSTVIEFLRFAFDQISDIEEINIDSYGKLEDLGGIGCVVEVGIVKQTGEEYVVKRTYDKFANPIEITRVSDGQIIDDNQLYTFFPVHAYSQGEALIISKNPLAQLDLIDNHLDIGKWKEEIRDAYGRLNNQISGLVNLEAVINDRSLYQSRLKTLEGRIAEVKGELGKIKAVQNNPVVKIHPSWMREKTYLTELVNSISQTRNEIDTYYSSMDFSITNNTLPEKPLPNQDILITTQNIANEFEAMKDETRKAFIEKLKDIEKRIRSEAEVWKGLYAKHEQEYKAIMATLGELKVQELINQLEGLEKDYAKCLADLTKVDAAQKQYNAQLKIRSENLELVNDRKNRIAIMRDKKATEIVKTTGRLRINLIKDGNREPYREYLEQVMVGSRARTETIEAVCVNIHPLLLVELIRQNDATKIDMLTGIGGWSQRIIEQFRVKPESIFRLQTLPIEDRLEISFEVENNKFRPLQKLSTGQKATVIVLLSMVEGSTPIIFDQPEDALYTPFIFSHIVKLVRDSKEKRQFIFATHNSNIAVASDLDLGIVLEGTSSSASIQSAGGLDDEKIKKLVILHLEGGEDAIKARLKEYQF
jgi:hypothetical protein